MPSPESPANRMTTDSSVSRVESSETGVSISITSLSSAQRRENGVGEYGPPRGPLSRPAPNGRGTHMQRLKSVTPSKLTSVQTMPVAQLSPPEQSRPHSE